MCVCCGILLETVLYAGAWGGFYVMTDDGWLSLWMALILGAIVKLIGRFVFGIGRKPRTYY